MSTARWHDRAMFYIQGGKNKTNQKIYPGFLFVCFSFLDGRVCLLTSFLFRHSGQNETSRSLYTTLRHIDGWVTSTNKQMSFTLTRRRVKTYYPVWYVCESCQLLWVAASWHFLCSSKILFFINDNKKIFAVGHRFHVWVKIKRPCVSTILFIYFMLGI